ncbi:MAG TPA: asparagine synthase-related protein [Bryobacteraceae bacterium]|jgi:hypothetical protein
MSYLAGICHFDSAAAVGMCEEDCENTAVSPAGLVCSLDGRLDNCSGRTSIVNRGARCALEAYELRGLDGLRELYGEWSLAIRDADGRKVVLATDYVGTRPLYYCRQGRVLRWSSSLDRLAQLTGAGSELDPQYAAEFLAFGSSLERTPYPEIRAVRPGVALEFSASTMRQTELWAPPVGRTITYKDPREYAEHLYSLFEEAVSLRVQTSQPVFAEFSGGLDSSSVAAMAARLVRESKTPCPKIVTVSYRQAGSTDEAFIDSGIDSRIDSQFGGGRGCESLDVDLDERSAACAGELGFGAPRMWQPRFAGVARHLGVSGSEVLLTGQLGDLTMSNFVDDSEQVGDRFMRWDLGGAWREAMQWSRSLRRPVFGILAQGLRLAVAGGQRPNESRPEVWRECEPSRRKRFLALRSVIESRSLQCPEALQDFEVSHPFAHRPLVEYVLRIPSEVTCRPGEPRRLMRQSFASLLPPAILNRRSKAAFTGLIHAGLRPIMRAIVDGGVRNMRLAEMNFVDPVSVGERIELLHHGLECGEDQLRRILLLEQWVRDREAGSARRSRKVSKDLAKVSF